MEVDNSLETEDDDEEAKESINQSQFSSVGHGLLAFSHGVHSNVSQRRRYFSATKKESELEESVSSSSSSFDVYKKGKRFN